MAEAEQSPQPPHETQEQNIIENQIRLGPLSIRALALRPIVSALTLDLVRGFPKPSPPDEPKIQCEIALGELTNTINQSRETVSAFILDLMRGYPEIATGVRDSRPPESPKR